MILGVPATALRLASIVCALSLSFWLTSGHAAAAQDGDGRVLVLGFDGADWRKTQSMMDAGELPNLAKLRDMGTAGPLVSTDPAESAAGWAAINTGANPVKNGVPSFIKRNIAGDSIVPGFAHVEPRTVPTDELGATGAVGVLGGVTDKVPPAGIAAIVLVVAFLVFRFLIGAHAALAVVLGLVLGGATYFALGKSTGTLPREIPGVVENKVALDGFWVDAARSGHPSVALQAPLAFDRPGADGARTLYGLGLPDVRSSLNGDWFVYTADTLETAREPEGVVKRGSSGTGTTFRVDFAQPEDGGAPRIETSLYGPVDFVRADELRRRHEALTKRLDDPDERAKLGFDGSRELLAECDEIAATLGEMGMALPGSPAISKVWKHRTKAPMQIERTDDGYAVTICGVTQQLDGKSWSDFFDVTFELSPLVSVHAVTRVRVVDEDPFELYVDTLNIDPRKAPFWQPASDPPGFSAELAQGIGSAFETLGWGCMTNQVKDKLVDPVYFLEDVEFTMTYRRKLMQRMLEQEDWRVLYSVFSTTDRVQHMMYRFHDPEHPAHDAEKAAQEVTFFGETIPLSDAIPAIYRQMDEIVGEAMGALEPNDTLLLCADHGFTSFRREVHVNNWLAHEGFLVMEDDLARTSEGRTLGSVDWSRTKAYSLGLGMVYLNLEGREPNGIVKPGEAQAVMEDICARFLAAEDEGRRIGTSATIVRDAYSGDVEWNTSDYPCADVMLGFAEYYRTSWKSVGGDVVLAYEGDEDPRPVVVGPAYKDNTNPWSGDHASNDPNLVSGIFFCNRKVKSADGTFSVMDIAPTVLSRLGAQVPAHYDRAPLEFQ